ncbi:MAG: glycosyltransferase family 2 protein [Cyclobacteriaceae bacterium]|nr:glycosyltransferase family 2 protein [Cyclobacteriaceae bacterium]
MDLSLVITLYNEEDNIEPLINRINNALQGIDYEVIMVDDGSKDTTVDKVHKFAGERIKLIRLLNNYGQTAAMSAGIEHAQGEVIALMDGDLQNDPEDIPDMLRFMASEGWDVVAGRRKNRQDGFVLRKLPSKIANKIIRWLTGVMVLDYGCSLKLIKSDVAKNLGLYGELHRFIPVLAHLQGARITNKDVRHHPRIHGQSKYGIGRTSRVVSDLLLMVFFQKYFKRPMHLFGSTGFALFAVGLMVNLYLLVLKILGEEIWGRPLLIFGITMFLAGIQLISLGFLAEILMRTYFESQGKRIFRIKSIETFPAH